MSELLNDSTEPTVEALIADGRPFVRCGCGFIAVSQSQEGNRWALEEHPCPQRGEEVESSGDTRWYEYVFSLWGLLIIVVLASAVLAALGKAKW